MLNAQRIYEMGTVHTSGGDRRKWDWDREVNFWKYPCPNTSWDGVYMNTTLVCV
jgi:hypothetical protein